MATDAIRAKPTARSTAERLAPGLEPRGFVHRNLGRAALCEIAIRRNEGQLTRYGPFNAITAPHTGRSPKDKFVVREPQSEGDIWWGNVNQEMTSEAFTELYGDVVEYLAAKDLFVSDLHTGADPALRVPVRFVSTNAWHSHFVRNMFLSPNRQELADFDPYFTVLHTPDMQADPDRHGTRSGTFVVLNFAERVALIGGTKYAGEMKKSIFTVLNYVYPKRGVLSMHCSANVGKVGDVAIFFGLSGTGKTTLSADPSRRLIGDDEHGWSEHGIFNFEGGCYAKVIGLSPTGEPEIYATTRMFGTILENVVVDPDSRECNLDDNSITENTRASYPIDFIPNHVPEGLAGHPQNMVFLTCDAFGVLPPIAKLTSDQAMYHFITGYTAKVAGTERGITEPQAAFSTCFGAPFLPLHPSVYAKMLGERIAEHGVNCWLVNTGWTGGPCSEGERMKLGQTRRIVSAALDGTLADVPTRRDPVFGVEVPTSVRDVPTEVLDPRNTWADAARYDERARKLAAMFRQNFDGYAGKVPDLVAAAGPTA